MWFVKIQSSELQGCQAAGHCPCAHRAGRGAEPEEGGAVTKLVPTLRMIYFTGYTAAIQNSSSGLQTALFAGYAELGQSEVFQEGVSGGTQSWRCMGPTFGGNT